MGSRAEHDVDEPLSVGDTAPDFTAPFVTPNGSVGEARFSDLLEQPVLLCFYTVDFSPDCIDEWCSFRDFDWFASGDDVRVVGVSKSGPRLHRQFIKRLDLGFPLYSDTNLDISAAFGVRYRAFGLFARSRRSCFLVDENREIRYRWLADHWLDATRDTPPVSDIHDAIVDELGLDDAPEF
ncbi:peroxiredoxin family protein [Halobaculum sp. P14]|uniref:peroxiredoxin family protein n=1 Tax=Halobaculum sp. P14 TaxID=3421638 RepID=UPI003EB78E6C